MNWFGDFFYLTKKEEKKIFIVITYTVYIQITKVILLAKILHRFDYFGALGQF